MTAFVVTTDRELRVLCVVKQHTPHGLRAHTARVAVGALAPAALRPAFTSHGSDGKGSRAGVTQLRHAAACMLASHTSNRDFEGSEQRVSMRPIVEGSQQHENAGTHLPLIRRANSIRITNTKLPWPSTLAAPTPSLPQLTRTSQRRRTHSRRERQQQHGHQAHVGQMTATHAVSGRAA